MSNAFSQVPVRTDVDGDVVVGIVTGATIGISGTPNVNVTNSSLNVAVTSALPTGANTIGAVTISGTPNVNITNSSLNVAVTSALPTGANTIGAVNINGTPTVTVGNSSLNVVVTSALPTGANVIGAVTISGTPTVSISGTVTTTLSGSIPSGSNSIGTVGLNTGTNSIGTVGLNAGTNIIGKVQVVETTGTVKYYASATSGNVTANGGTSTVNATAITSGTTGKLRSVTVGSSVAMMAQIRKDNTTSPVIVQTVYIPAGGGTLTKEWATGAVSQAGTVLGENFDVVFTNLDKRTDAEAFVSFTWDEE